MTPPIQSLAIEQGDRLLNRTGCGCGTGGERQNGAEAAELKRTEEARDNLLRVVDKFPDDPILRYNLACYECQLGRLEQAKGWLEKAFKLGDPKKIKLMALEDRDLEPLWREIGKA